jgi:transposase InsO family protein
MRYPAAEKREIIELVERSSLPVRRTLAHLGIPKSTFYGWYARYRDVTATLSLALEASGLASAKAHHRPRLLSDNGPSYVSAELRHWLDDQGIGHTRGAPYHPMTQGKIERWHRSMKNQVLLENYYFPGDLKARIGQFVHYYNSSTAAIASSRKRWPSGAGYTTNRRSPDHEPDELEVSLILGRLLSETL